MVWSSNCNTVAPIAHAVIIARWGVSWWTVSPDMVAALLSSATQAGGCGQEAATVKRDGADSMVIALVWLVHEALTAAKAPATQGILVSVVESARAGAVG